jgi:molybdenum transport protein
MYIGDDALERFIKEDIPYIDLTTLVLNIAGKKGRIGFECRDEAVICGTEEVLRILGKLNVTPLHHLPSGTRVEPHTVVLAAEGSADNLHMAWKVCQNILEYASGIATRTSRILAQARTANPGIELLSTRKIFPGTKELSIKAVVAGGGTPHRLGLSETILIFEQHWAFLGGFDNLMSRISALKAKNIEKKIIVEVASAAEAIEVCKAGADGVQFDKMPYNELPQAVKILRGINPDLVILAAGGINEENAANYAGTGINAIVTTAVYFGKPVNFGVNIRQSEASSVQP